MAKLSKLEREAIARRRLLNILRQHGIATARTLEQKISDAGPNSQRVDPHILTTVRKQLISEKRLLARQEYKAPWYFLPETDSAVVDARLGEQLHIWKQLRPSALTSRIGQTLEIATYRCLLQTQLEFFGRFRDLNKHDDSEIYSKEEPPQHIGSISLSGDKRLDFLVRHPTAGWLGIECKNVREWLYPNRSEVKEAIAKCLSLDCVPVIIARRIPFVTFRLFYSCGVILHQIYNQLYPSSESELAQVSRLKTLLGYHDVRVGNSPDKRLQTFIKVNLPTIASGAKERFHTYRDLLEGFAIGDYSYTEFAARVRRRENGTNEDNDWPERNEYEDE